MRPGLANLSLYLVAAPRPLLSTGLARSTSHSGSSPSACRYAVSKGCELSDELISAALQNRGSKQSQYKSGACIRWLLAHRCPVPARLEPTDLYIVSVKRHMLKERRTWAMAVLRRPPVSGLPSLPLSCCESVLARAELWIPLSQAPASARPSKRQRS